MTMKTLRGYTSPFDSIQPPERWMKATLRRMVESISNGTTATQVEEQTDYRVTRIQTISNGEIDLSKIGYIHPFSGLESFRLRRGDILFSHINSLSMVGNVAHFDGNVPLYSGMNLLRIRPRSDCHSRFLFYWLKCGLTRQVVEALAKPAINQASIPVSSVLALPVFCPPLAEQRAIADFLDRETAKIDGLISKQEELIQSIEEHRRSYVYSCVTKGIDSKVALIESGIPWLGLVPAHWNVRPLKFFAEFNAGAGFPDAEQGLTDEELPFFKVKDLGSQEPDAPLVSTDNTISRATAKRLRAHVFPPRTIVMAKIGAALLLNRFRMVGVACCLDNNMLGIECDDRKIAPDFALSLMGAVLDMRMLVNPGAVPSLNETRLGRLKIAVPSLSEQQAIVAHLRGETEKLGRLRHQAVSAVRVLHERRSALITAAVTGQIEVTAKVAAEAAA